MARTLTRRQVQILQLVSEGLENSQIGDRLFLSKETVKCHLYKAYQVLDARSRTDAAVKAYAAGVIKGPEPVDVVVSSR
jgi:DNA-binding NarL/FixJ family response regulator